MLSSCQSENWGALGTFLLRNNNLNNYPNQYLPFKKPDFFKRLLCFWMLWSHHPWYKVWTRNSSLLHYKKRTMTAHWSHLTQQHHINIQFILINISVTVLTCHTFPYFTLYRFPLHYTADFISLLFSLHLILFYFQFNFNTLLNTHDFISILHKKHFTPCHK